MVWWQSNDKLLFEPRVGVRRSGCECVRILGTNPMTLECQAQTNVVMPHPDDALLRHDDCCWTNVGLVYRGIYAPFGLNLTSFLLLMASWCRIWSWSPMACKKHGPRDSVDKNRGRRLRFLSLLRPEGHVFHTAWEPMIILYYSTFADWYFQCFIPGLGSIPFFQFNSNSNSFTFNSNSNSFGMKNSNSSSNSFLSIPIPIPFYQFLFNSF